MNFKINKGKKPALNYYVSAYKANETLRSKRIQCNILKKEKKREERFLIVLLEWRVDFLMTEDGVSASDCSKTQSAEQCGSQQLIYFRYVLSPSQATA